MAVRSGVDKHLDRAVVVEVAEGGAAGRVPFENARPGLLGDVQELATEVAIEDGAVAVANVAFQPLDLREDVAVHQQQVLPGIVVEIKEAAAPADEDGRPDILMANGHVCPEVDRAAVGDRYYQKTLFYRNLGNGRFADHTGQAGLALQQPRPARGLATGDLDGDGHPEVVIVNMNEKPSLLRNCGPRGNAVLVALVGTKSNRSAIGARVLIDTSGRKQMREVISGGSYYSQNDLALHFGLGATAVIDRLEVRWPSGMVQPWKAVAANRKLIITEGADALEQRPLRGR